MCSRMLILPLLTVAEITPPLCRMVNLSRPRCANAASTPFDTDAFASQGFAPGSIPLGRASVQRSISRSPLSQLSVAWVRSRLASKLS